MRPGRIPAPHAVLPPLFSREEGADTASNAAGDVERTRSKKKAAIPNQRESSERKDQSLCGTSFHSQKKQWMFAGGRGGLPHLGRARRPADHLPHCLPFPRSGREPAVPGLATVLCTCVRCFVQDPLSPCIPLSPPLLSPVNLLFQVLRLFCARACAASRRGMWAVRSRARA